MTYPKTLRKKRVLEAGYTMDGRRWKLTWDEAWDLATIEERKTVRRWNFQKDMHDAGKTRRWGSALSYWKGDKNQCPGCGEFFNSSAAFDKHRTGAFGTEKNHKANRRCMTVSEMTEKGMIRTPDFWWVTMANAFSHQKAQEESV